MEKNLSARSARPELLFGKSVEVARRAEEEIRSILSKHKDLIPNKTVDLIAQRQAAAALIEYRERRIRGLANDDSSQEPGLTAYLTSQGRDRIVALCLSKGYPIPEKHFQEITQEVVALRLPKGIYEMGGGGCLFHQEADAVNDDNARKPFSAGYHEIVRIEGDANELWQNVNYTWKGTPRKASR